MEIKSKLFDRDVSLYCHLYFKHSKKRTIKIHISRSHNYVNQFILVHLSHIKTSYKNTRT
jgi:hypothetical protein